MVTRLSIAGFVAGGLAVAEVGAETGIDAAQRASATEDSPFAGYGVKGVHHDALSKGLSGLIGVAVTFLVAALALWLVRRRRVTSAATSPSESGAA
jgi:cobalt/nickel transport system permease protein